VDHAKDEQWAAIEAYFDSDPIAYARAYYETYVERTWLHRPDVLGHFDVVIKHNFVDEESPAYRRMAAEALAACLEVTPIVEINTGSVIRKWRDRPFPALFLLREIRALGGRIIFSSDSHCADTLSGWFDEGARLAKAVGFDSMMQLRGGIFEEVGL